MQIHSRIAATGSIESAPSQHSGAINAMSTKQVANNATRWRVCEARVKLTPTDTAARTAIRRSSCSSRHHLSGKPRDRLLHATCRHQPVRRHGGRGQGGDVPGRGHGRDPLHRLRPDRAGAADHGTDDHCRDCVNQYQQYGIPQ